MQDLNDAAIARLTTAFEAPARAVGAQPTNLLGSPIGVDRWDSAE